MEQRIGVIGVDYLTAHLVEGLFHGGGRPRVTLGPRQREWCEHLGRRHRVGGARSDQQVIDTSDVLLLRLEGEALDRAGPTLRFRDDQLVVGVGMYSSLSRLARAVHPARAVRAAVLAAVAVGEGAVCLHPPERHAERVLAALGEVHHLRDEPQFEACAAVFASYDWLLTLSDETAGWLRQQGLDPAVAASLAARVPRATGHMAASRHEAAAEQAAALAGTDPPAALGARVLQRAELVTSWRRALEVVLSAHRRGR